jgi:3-oxoacyl-[acyl-carrier protein] reductase
MSKSFAGKAALVTGASRGIGSAIAASLAAAGAHVLVAARGREAAEAMAARLREGGGSAEAVPLDVGDDGQVADVIAGLLKAHGTIPLLVNNAGITRDNLLMRMKQEEWDDVIGTNLTGIYRVCRAVVPSMVRARYGRIVNITSVSGRAGNPGQVNYAASKAGIEGFTRSLARELAGRNVTVNCVAPGFIDTDMTRALGEAQRAELLSRVPMRRLGTPEDVASAVGFLLGEGAAYITGITLDVNGGMYM